MKPDSILNMDGDSANEMTAYNLKGSKISSHDGSLQVSRIIGTERRYTWESAKRDTDCVGQIHIKFKKPIIMNGFGLTVGSNRYQYPSDFRLYAKVIRHKG